MQEAHSQKSTLSLVGIFGSAHSEALRTCHIQQKINLVLPASLLLNVKFSHLL